MSKGIIDAIFDFVFDHECPYAKEENTKKSEVITDLNKEEKYNGAVPEWVGAKCVDCKRYRDVEEQREGQFYCTYLDSCYSKKYKPEACRNFERK